eukprot:evm.model.scf_3002.2 EVM.evm.TU.scf_3002.2   scf_3002:6237-14035(+)
MMSRGGSPVTGRGVAFVANGIVPGGRSAARWREGRRGAVALAVARPMPEAWRGADLEDLSLPGGSYGWPVMGETVEYLKDMHAFALERMSKHGNVFKSHIFGFKTVVVCSTEALNEISRLEAAGSIVTWPMMPGLKVFGEGNLAVLNGDEHANMRKLLHSVFSRGSVLSSVPFIFNTAKEICAEFEGQEHFSMAELARKYAFKVSTKSFLGMEFPSRVDNEVIQILEVLGEGVFTLGIDLPLTKFHRAMKSRCEMIDVIKESLKAMDSISPEDGRPATALEQMLDARDEGGNGLEMEALINTIILLVYGGYETTSATMECILRKLALNPKAWDRLREEQHRVVEIYGDDITCESLEAMVYARAVVKEGLRVQTALPFSYKWAKESFELEGYRIPANWQVVCGSGFITQHLCGSDSWNDHDAYRPERFLDPRTDKLSSFRPFGHGRHICLGKELALTELWVMLALLARRYEVTLKNLHAHIKPYPTPHAEDGCMATLRELHAAWS